MSSNFDDFTADTTVAEGVSNQAQNSTTEPTTSHLSRAEQSEAQQTEAKRFLREGINAAKNGNRSEARQLLLEAAQLDAGNESVWLWLASISEQPAELFEFLQKVLEINSENARAQEWYRQTKNLLVNTEIQRGAALVKENQRAEAGECFRRATEYDSANETAWLWRASVTDEIEDKLAFLQRILYLNPNNEKAAASFHAAKRQMTRNLLKRGSAAAVSGDFATAREILADAMEYDDQLEEVWLLKAFVSETSAEKAECFRKVLEINPANAQARFGLDSLQTAAEPTVEETSETADPETKEFQQESESEESAFEEPQQFVEENGGENQVKTLQAEEQVAHEDEAAENQRPVEPETSEEDFHSQFVEKIACPFCAVQNPVTAARCASCKAFVSIDETGGLLVQDTLDDGAVREFIERLHSEQLTRSLSWQEHLNLGFAYLNLKNFKKGAQHFERAVESAPGDESLRGKVNQWLEKLQEIAPELLNGAASSGKTIMVVDDSPTVRKLIMGKLEKHGHRVVAAIDGMDALAKIPEENPDLILLDVTMPRLDGYQLCKLIRQNSATKHIPVVMISGKDGFFDKVRGRMAGSTAYITKPFGPETLIQTVETYCK